jgi:hypothetical protein
VPVGAAQPSSVGSFGRNRRFRHFNKLTVRDFAGAKQNGRAATDARIPFARPRRFDCAGTEMLQRPVAAIRSKAQREGISLKPANRSPYNRRSKAAKRR